MVVGRAVVAVRAARGRALAGRLQHNACFPGSGSNRGASKSTTPATINSGSSGCNGGHGRPQATKQSRSRPGTAPARILAYASSPLATPPTPTMGSLPPVSVYMRRSTCGGSGKRGEKK